MAASVTSLRLPDDVREQYETLARATGRTRNDLMVAALRRQGERQLREIAMVQEGLADLQAGRKSPIEDVIARFVKRGMLADGNLEPDTESVAE